VTTTAQIFNKDTGVVDVTLTYDGALSYVIHHEKKTWQSAIAGWKLKGILLLKDVPPEDTPDLEHIAWDDPRFITALKPYLETQFGDLLEIRLSGQSSDA